MKTTYTSLLSSIVLGLFLFFGCILSAQASSQPYITDHQINFGTGNKYLSATDVMIDGPGIGLSFKRIYNSQDNTLSLLGYGWSTRLTEKLTLNTDSIYLTQADGRVVYFSDDGSGTFINDSGRTRTIVSNADGYLLTEHNGTTKQFDSTGKLTLITRLNNNTLTYSYTGDQLDSITTNFGRSLSFIYTDGKLSQLIAPTGTVGYSYDANDNLTTITNQDNTTVQYIYDDPNDIHNLTGILDENGERILTVTYDNEDRATSSAFTGGQQRVSIAYNGFRERVITDSENVDTTYTLTVKKGLVIVDSHVGPGCSSCGSTSDTAYTYNNRAQVLTATDGNGVTTSYEYDVNGNRITTTRAVGTAEETVTTRTYTANNRVATISVASVAGAGQKVTTHSYDTGGNLLTTTESGFDGADAITRTTAYTYNSYGQITSIDGPRTDVTDTTTFTYYPNTSDQNDNRGHLHTVVNGLGHTVTYSDYSPFGQPRTITSPLITTTMTYDSRGRLHTRTQGGLTTTYTYDQAGKLTSVALPEGRTITYSYTALDKISSITDNLGNKIEYFYDTRGHKSREEIKDPQGILTRFVEYSYHDDGRLNLTTYADGTTNRLDYDNVGNLVARINGADKTTAYGYDSLNRLTTITEPGTVVTGYAYDTQGNITGVTDAEHNTTSFVFDDFGNRLTRISPDSGNTAYSYDLAGNLLSQADANGITTSYTYDALNRLTSISYPDGNDNISYTYDENGHIGQLTTMVDATGTTNYSYDVFGRLIQEYRSTGSATTSIRYRYNALNELVRLVYPNGLSVEYRRDPNGRITGIDAVLNGLTSPVLSDITWLPFGPVQSMVFGNELETVHIYDQRYQLQNTTTTDTCDYTYERYPDGNIQLITDNSITSNTQSFIYDDLERLTSADGSYGLISYSYDNNANRLERILSTGRELYAYTPGTNRLEQVSGDHVTDFTLDPVGNTIAMDTRTLGYNGANRLTSVTEADAPNIAYRYNAHGQRVQKTVGTQTTLYYYDIGGRLIAEHSSDKSNWINYIYLDDMVVAALHYQPESAPRCGGDLNGDGTVNQMDFMLFKSQWGLSCVEDVCSGDLNGDGVVNLADFMMFRNEWGRDDCPQPALYFYHNDHLGTPRQITNVDGDVVWAADYLPFGKAQVFTEEIVNNLRFPGQYYDAETGLHYNWHRYYDPETGRYISADPIGLAGGMNLYAYVENDPVNWVDPWGLMKNCPSTKAEASNNSSEWREYAPKGDWFHRYGEKRYHCGYKCYQEIQEEETCPENKQQECCYDENGVLATNDCRGTANSYDARTDPLKHIFLDPGGIYHSGHAGEIESWKHACANGASCSTSNNGTVW